MFIERRFFDDIRVGAVGGPEYRTTVKTMRGGAEHRNSLWADPLRSFNVALGLRDNDGIQDILNFSADTRGAAAGFRIKDWSDHVAINQRIGVGDGLSYFFRLVKSYGLTYQRRILKPVAGTVAVTVDGVSAVVYLDTVNGVVVFKNPPAVGVLIDASFEFDVPVRFASDMTDITMAYHAKGSQTSVEIKEIRVREMIDIAAYDTQRALL